MNKYENIALTSLILYFFLFLISLYYYISLKYGSSMTTVRSRGRYDDPKMSFFFLIAVSAILDVPLYAGCLYEGGPFECEWNSKWFSVFWILHLVAVLGYTVSLCIPAILWYDVIVIQDGRLFSSEYKPSHLKIFLRGIIAIYVIIQVVNIIGVIQTMTLKSDENFQTINNPFFALLYFSDAFLSLAITMVILFTGVSLQCHVMKRLSENCMSSFLFSLNFVMIFIVCSYILRALFVVNLYLSYNHESQFISVNEIGYMPWLLVTAWLPHVACSLALLRVMIQKYDFKNYSNRSAEHRVVDYLFGYFPCTRKTPLSPTYEANVSSNCVMVGEAMDDEEDSNYDLKVSPERFSRPDQPLLRPYRDRAAGSGDDGDQYSVNFGSDVHLSAHYDTSLRLSVSEQSSSHLFPAMIGGTPVQYHYNNARAESNSSSSTGTLPLAGLAGS